MNYRYISTVYIVYTFRAYEYYFIYKHIGQWIGILINTERCTYRLRMFHSQRTFCCHLCSVTCSLHRALRYQYNF